MTCRRVLLSGTAAVLLSVFADGASAAESVGAYTLNLFVDAPRVVPMGGEVNPSYGDINPFYGNISPFFGNISPFWGDINPFWGDINPFSGDVSNFWGDLNPFYGNINPFWGQIQPFWGDLAPFWGTINPFWGSLQPFSDATAAQYGVLQSQLQDFYARSEAMWGARILAATGKDFAKGFADALFAKYGIKLDKPETLSGLSAEQRARFFMDWYDGLMNFSGMDRVDHWMATVNWTPALTQDQGRGADAVVGLLDARITGDADLQGNVEYAGGYSNGVSSDHGAAVASLIWAEHDGKGVMGIAPAAHVMLYNPFDNTGTASWQDVRNGIVSLSQHGADVINLSLGVPGWTLHQGLVDIISDPSLKDQLKNIVFVAAAGNSGQAQTANVAWQSSLSRNNLIVVGSVGLDKTISSFSNTPGEACILVGGACAETDKLKYHFLVAPGELMLVSDNHGGVTRVSGTSFAAPLVSGALTLLYDRWPWLQQKPNESAQIILQSAKDLGAPGVDAVYGWGLLDVEASQSPLKFDNLVVFQGLNQISTQSLKTMALSATTRGTWQTNGASLLAFESIGNTYRDFTIPLSSLLNGQRAGFTGRFERFQRHMYGRLIDWANGTSSFAPMGRMEQTGVAYGDWTVSLSGGEADPYSDAYDPELPFEMGYAVKNELTGVGFHFGYGDGATAAFAQPGFAFHSDYDAATGGVNPILGFAVGDAYFGASYDVSASVTLMLGYSQFSDSEAQNPLTGGQMQPLTAIDAYAASALVFDVKYFANDWLTLSANYTQLTEETGLLGVQGMGALSLAGGATTDAITIGAALELAKDLTLSLSATGAKTRSTTFDSALAVSPEGVTSTAFAVSLQQDGVFEKSDAIRFSLLQPLHIESGSLDYTSQQVVDRDTGELGPVTDHWAISNGEREIAAEVLYATPVFDAAAELSFTARVPITGGEEGVTIGSRFAVRF